MREIPKNRRRRLVFVHLSVGYGRHYGGSGSLLKNHIRIFYELSRGDQSLGPGGTPELE